MAFPLATTAMAASLYWTTPFFDVALAVLAYLLAREAGRLYRVCGMPCQKYLHYAFILITLGLLSAAASEFHVMQETLAGEEAFHSAIFCDCSGEMENLGSVAR